MTRTKLFFFDLVLGVFKDGQLDKAELSAPPKGKGDGKGKGKPKA
jgi:hypothetical protein